ncbi:MAG: hypothetical protein JXI43_09250 [Tissierellales bacterium]|nr:hypothetical protein [Tissierellales bacterium]
MFVYSGKPKRIIYVGTCFDRSRGFSRRWKTHIDLFKKGGRATWKMSNMDGDIYSLMTFKEDAIFYYEKLSLNGKLWIPYKIDDKSFYNSYYDHNTFFSKDWQNYIDEYLPKIEIWTCHVDKKEVGYFLETMLQVVIGKKYNIGYYCKSTQNWLGRQQCNIKFAEDFNFDFYNTPALDLESKNLLSNLNANFKSIMKSGL